MSEDAELEGLQRRGFEPWMSVGIADGGPRKIMAIKEVRALTGLGLKDAKDTVEQGLLLFEGLTPARATEVATRVETTGARARIELSRAHRYAFRPGDPRRGDQLCERMSVRGHELELARGQIGAWGEPQRLAGRDEELFAAIDRQRARWAEAGLHEAGSELELVLRLSARDERLEAQVRAGEGQALRRAAAVYGDWLQSQGDPRGLVAALALALDEAQDDQARAQRAAALDQAVAEHAAHLFGPAQALLEHARVSWSGPILDSVELPSSPIPDELDCSGQLEHLLALPICAGLRSLKLLVDPPSPPSLSNRFAEHPTLADLLAQAPCASSLRTLSVAGSRRFACGTARFDRLERLELTTVELALGRLIAPRLERLRVELRFPSNDLAATFAGLDAPQLQDFEFVTEIYDHWDQNHGPLHTQLRRLFELPSFGRLRRLTLRTLERSLPYQAELCDVLLAMPAIASLEHIDLRGAHLMRSARSRLRAAAAQLPGLLL